ncbi:MAG: tRNA (guanosine(46)-N7)-methyltransferase TrmB [Planctomycetota bacterium]
MHLKTLKDYPEISLNLQDLTEPFNHTGIFGNNRPLHIEIGSGKGTFILNQAKNNPQTNFLGIEWANKYYRYTVDRLGRWKITNARLIRTDAEAFIADFIPSASVECFHIYFPDPWPKKRHHKRRFINRNNLDQMIRCLLPAGTIRIATDHAEYFEAITKLLKSNTDRLELTDFFPATGTIPGEWVGTNFEKKYLKQGQPIYTMAAQKISLLDRYSIYSQ